MTFPSLLHRRKAFSTAARRAGVGVPSPSSILWSMFVERMVAGASLPKASSAASPNRATAWERTLDVTSLPPWPRSVGSPASRKSGPTEPCTRNSRTAVRPCELKSPQTTTGVAEASSPSRLHSLATESSASWACLRRRSAAHPAVRWQLTTTMMRPSQAPPRRFNATTRVRSLCRAPTFCHSSCFQKVAGLMRPFFSWSSPS
mmetsp:Transcript_42774/g.115362  ORF Transcript_42774/g.115362 Transcript_42774/m.115362 type:complete len:203 (+) Transcript_42774:496-1104(+)